MNVAPLNVGCLRFTAFAPCYRWKLELAGAGVSLVNKVRLARLGHCWLAVKEPYHLLYDGIILVEIVLPIHELRTLFFFS